MKVQNLVYGKRYTTKNGEEKTQWITIGKLFTNEKGQQNALIELIPTNWNGSCCVFDIKEQPQTEERVKLPENLGVAKEGIAEIFPPKQEKDLPF